MRVGFDFLANRNIYREYRRRINVREVLEHYNAENCYEIAGSDGTTEIVHSCLLDRVEPHHRNGDQNPSAAMNVEKKTFVCYNYWGGDIFHLILKMEKKESFGDILPIVGDFLDGATSNNEDFLQEVDRILSRESSFLIEIPEYSTRILDPWGFSHPYIRERGISLEASSKLQIGYDPDTNRIVFPHFWEGKLVGWQQRSIPTDPRWPGSSPQLPKYKNSSGFPKSETIYGVQWLESANSVVVVESPMSVAKANSLGVPNVLATFGAKVSQNQIDFLKEFPEVVVWFDADNAGDLAARKVAKNLYRHTNVKIVVSEEGKDLADYDSAAEINSMIESAVPAILLLSQWEKEKDGTKKKSS
jgi:5S rRNA maturation endonuclease (ribonuclease M5)